MILAYEDKWLSISTLFKRYNLRYGLFATHPFALGPMEATVGAACEH